MNRLCNAWTAEISVCRPVTVNVTSHPGTDIVPHQPMAVVYVNVLVAPSGNRPILAPPNFKFHGLNFGFGFALAGVAGAGFAFAVVVVVAAGLGVALAAGVPLVAVVAGLLFATRGVRFAAARDGTATAPARRRP
jgi:hypothetical protein